MYKSLFIFGMVLSPFTLQYVSGQFPGFSGAESGFPSFKLSGPLGQLMTGGLGSNGLRFMNSNLGFGQLLGSLVSGTTSSSGGPLQQLATAASTQYMNAIRSHPLLSQFANAAAASASSQQGPPPPAAAQHPYGAVAPPPPPGMHHGAPPSPYHHQPPMHSPMHNPMALLGGDSSSMYGPPGQPGYESHYGGGGVYPQYTAPDSYFGGQYGPPAPAASHPMAAVYPPPSYPHLPPAMHLDRK